MINSIPLTEIRNQLVEIIAQKLPDCGSVQRVAEAESGQFDILAQTTLSNDAYEEVLIELAESCESTATIPEAYPLPRTLQAVQEWLVNYQPA